MTQPALGDRVMFHGAVGTVLYKGPVAGTSGEWLGIDWDEGERGKHDGSKDGTRYFHCRYDTSLQSMLTQSRAVLGSPASAPAHSFEPHLLLCHLGSLSWKPSTINTWIRES